MRLNLIVTAWIGAVLSGCASHEGTYSPSCIAFEGSNIQLSDGRFAWEKFTDAVVVDDDGNVVNQFPGYPLRGTYRVEGNAVHMQADSGMATAPMYLHSDGDREYLLSAEQWKAAEASGEYAECALVLGGNRDT